MKRLYTLELDKKQIGYTEFEYADTPMGVVHGKIIFKEINSPYQLFKNHCVKYNVEMNLDDFNERFIDTVVIPQLKVYLENGEELKGWGGAITGMDSDDFEIQFGGISSELMQTEFEHHYKKYFEKE